MRALKPEEIVTALKAAGETTRLRLLALLARGEHNVKDLTKILGQSQPRISRHLKLLYEAGLIERFREGSWVYFRLVEEGPLGALIGSLIAGISDRDADIARDRARSVEVKSEREQLAQNYFRIHAGEWDDIRALHVAEDDVETAISEVTGGDKISLLVDIGTGTGRILELLAGNCRRGIGFDINQDMLAYARSKLEHHGVRHCQVRLGDIYNLPLEDGMADLVVIHQVLHFLDDPARAVMEAARICAPGGRVLIVDFSPHELDYLRDNYAHRRLGFSRDQIERWMGKGGLRLVRQRDMAPGEGGGDVKGRKRLTVSLWLGQPDDTAAGRNLKTSDMDLEAIGR